MKAAFSRPGILLPLLGMCMAGGFTAGIRPGPGPVAASEGFRFMWYNVENLFYPENDPATDDDEFTAEGIRHWTIEKYRRKLALLSKVIVATGRGEPPDLVGLCEVENSRVLEDLAGHPILKRYGYEPIHFESPDVRGIDVACLYRRERFNPVESQAIPSAISPGTGTDPDPGVGEGTSGSLGRRPTRDVLHITGVWRKADTVDLLLLHFISRYSGTAATVQPRRTQVMQLAELADSLSRFRERCFCILAGDFNDEPGSPSMFPLQSGWEGTGPLIRIVFAGSPGSYKYHGRWSFIDHVFVAGRMCDYLFRGRVFCLPVMLTEDEAYGGQKPWRTYDGYRYSAGISDHLPLLLDIVPIPASGHSWP